MQAIHIAKPDNSVVATIWIKELAIELEIIGQITYRIDNIKIDDTWFKTLVALYFSSYDLKIIRMKNYHLKFDQEFTFENILNLINFYQPIIKQNQDKINKSEETKRLEKELSTKYEAKWRFLMEKIEFHNRLNIYRFKIFVPNDTDNGKKYGYYLAIILTEQGYMVYVEKIFFNDHNGAKVALITILPNAKELFAFLRITNRVNIFGKTIDLSPSLDEEKIFHSTPSILSLQPQLTIQNIHF